MQPTLTKKAMEQMDEAFKLKIEALDIFKLVVAEWETDPQSVQCFDLRIVNRARQIVDRLKKIDVLF